MFISQALVVTFAALTASQAYPQLSACTNPVTRLEWRQLSPQDRQSYVAAVHCLKSKPSRLGLRTSLYDDFPYVHNALNDQIHLVAAFLPWHRYFVYIYEQALQDCGYQGHATYWDWAFDSLGDVSRAPMWDPTDGFGGNGNQRGSSRGSNCVTNGPFRDIRPSYRRDNHQPHCLSRDFNDGSNEIGDMSASRYTPNAIRPIQAMRNYNSYRTNLEDGPHFAIHRAIGGDMTPATSPNDPIFFLHHGQLDRLWYFWQQRNPQRRNSEYSGNRIQEQFGGDSTQASPNDILPMLGLAPDLPVGYFLSTQGSVLCYKY